MQFWRMGGFRKEKVLIYCSLIFIVFLSLFIRIYNLNDIPSGFHQDEAANAYMGKFILLNGKDFYGNPWPIFYFDKWGDYPPVIPMYFAGLGSLVFGDTPFGARITIAFFGALTVLPLYFLAKKLFGKTLPALSASLFLSILPWHVAFSRTAAEGVLALFFYTTGLALYLEKPFKLKLSALPFFLLSYLSYPSFRLIIPLTFLGLLFFKKLTSGKLAKITLFSFAGFLLLTAWVSTTYWGSARFKQTSIITAVKQNQEYYNQFIYDEKSPLVARIFHNKVVNVAREFIKQYLSYFSPVFLFVEGGRPDWYKFPNSGLLYLTQLILVAVVVIAPFFKKNLPINPKTLSFLIFLLLISPLPAALTVEHAIHMHRSIALILPWVLLSSLGLQTLLSLFKGKTKKYLAIFLITLPLAIEFINFSHNYFAHISSYSSLHRSEGNKHLAVFLKENKKKYKNVHLFITGWFPVYHLYFTSNYSPEIIGKIKRMYTPRLDNINFIPKNCPENEDLETIPKGELVIFSSICDLRLYRNLKKLQTIDNITKTPIFVVLETF